MLSFKDLSEANKSRRYHCGMPAHLNGYEWDTKYCIKCEREGSQTFTGRMFGGSSDDSSVSSLVNRGCYVTGISGQYFANEREKESRDDLAALSDANVAIALGVHKLMGIVDIKFKTHMPEWVRNKKPRPESYELNMYKAIIGDIDGSNLNKYYIENFDDLRTLYDYVSTHLEKVEQRQREKGYL